MQYQANGGDGGRGEGGKQVKWFHELDGAVAALEFKPIGRRADNATMTHSSLAALMLMALALGGCSPKFNWREVRLEQSGVALLFPCKPDTQVRQVDMDGQALSMTLSGCSAGDASFALAYARLGEGNSPGAALRRWRELTLGNLGAQGVNEMAYPLQGVRSDEQSVRLGSAGRRPDGSSLVAQAFWFTHDRWVYQASVLAERPREAEADTFMTSIRLP